MTFDPLEGSSNSRGSKLTSKPTVLFHNHNRNTNANPSNINSNTSDRALAPRTPGLQTANNLDTGGTTTVRRHCTDLITNTAACPSNDTDSEAWILICGKALKSAPMIPPDPANDVNTPTLHIPYGFSGAHSVTATLMSLLQSNYHDPRSYLPSAKNTAGYNITPTVSRRENTADDTTGQRPRPCPPDHCFLNA